MNRQKCLGRSKNCLLSVFRPWLPFFAVVCFSIALFSILRTFVGYALAMPTTSQAAAPAAPCRQFTLLDSTAIIVGIIIGSSIYEMVPPTIVGTMPNVSRLIGVWVAGGRALAVRGPLLRGTGHRLSDRRGRLRLSYPGLGPTVGFLFAWAQFWVVRPGSIGAWPTSLPTMPTGCDPLGRAPAGHDRLRRSARSAC